MVSRRGAALLLLATLLAATSYTVHMIFNIEPRPFIGFYINDSILRVSSVVLHSHYLAVAYCVGNLTVIGHAVMYIPSKSGTVMQVPVIGNVRVLHGCFKINNTLTCMNIEPSSIKVHHDILIMMVNMTTSRVECSNCTISISIVNSTFTPPVLVKALSTVEILCRR